MATACAVISEERDDLAPADGHARVDERPDMPELLGYVEPCDRDSAGAGVA